jgi:hypothetical protein
VKLKFSDWCLIGLLVFLVLAVIAVAVTGIRGRAECLGAGYARMDLGGLRVYCVRLESGTEVVVPIEQVREGR